MNTEKDQNDWKYLKIKTERQTQTKNIETCIKHQLRTNNSSYTGYRKTQNNNKLNIEPDFTKL